MMTYNVHLKSDGEIVDSTKCEDDEHLFMALGRWAILYFLAFDSVDYRDAYHTMSPLDCAPDALLAFTCDKETDEPEGPHRHGQPKNKLGYGAIWVDGKKAEMSIIVRREEDEQED